jgi:hypothetical protein
MALQMVDLSDFRLSNENEIDNAIYAVLVAAFLESSDEELIRAQVRSRISDAPTPVELIDAVCAELRQRGRLQYERYRREQASLVLAAFLELPASEREDCSLMPAA